LNWLSGSIDSRMDSSCMLHALGLLALGCLESHRVMVVLVGDSNRALW